MAKVAGASLMGLNAWERHQRFMHDMMTYYGGKLPELPGTVKTDYDTLKEHYRFIRTEDDDAEGGWEVSLARRYYAKLFKEYAIADLSRYKEGKIGVRWRTEKEVVSGKGQFMCGAKGCEERRGLASFEVPLLYVEAGVQKRALVKVRVCPKHALQLNYRKNKELLKAEMRSAKKRRSSGKEVEAGDGGSAQEDGPGEKKRRRHSVDDQSAGETAPGRNHDDCHDVNASPLSGRKGLQKDLHLADRTARKPWDESDQSGQPARARTEEEGGSAKELSRNLPHHTGKGIERDQREASRRSSQHRGERREGRHVEESPRSPQGRGEVRGSDGRQGSGRSSHRSRERRDGRDEKGSPSSPQGRCEMRGRIETEGSHRSSHARSRAGAGSGIEGSGQASGGRRDCRERREGREGEGSLPVGRASVSPSSPGRWGDDQEPWDSTRGLSSSQQDEEDLDLAADVDAFFEGMFL